MSVTVSISEVGRMLDKCALGHTIRRTTHGKVVAFNDKVYRDLPKFDEIEIGHIRKMVRHLGIDKECARKNGCF
jgi:hypothetical protein